jgi:hypothetical protein
MSRRERAGIGDVEGQLFRPPLMTLGNAAAGLVRLIVWVPGLRHWGKPALTQNSIHHGARSSLVRDDNESLALRRRNLPELMTSRTMPHVYTTGCSNSIYQYDVEIFLFPTLG